MQNQAASNKRKEKDVMKLMMSGKYDVRLLNEESTSEFEVMFKGPVDSPYVGVSKPNDQNIYSLIQGTWKVLVRLPDLYPYKSPSIGFKNRIFHPNIDEA